jgi:hypothetical protein
MIKYAVLAGMIGIMGLVTAALGSTPFAVAQVAPAQSVGIWEALGILSHAVAPAIGGMAAVVIWLHRRLNHLERSNEDLDTSVFGNDRDALNEGVLNEVRHINSRIDDVQNSIESLADEHQQLWNELEKKK